MLHLPNQIPPYPTPNLNQLTLSTEKNKKNNTHQCAASLSHAPTCFHALMLIFVSDLKSCRSVFVPDSCRSLCRISNLPVFMPFLVPNFNSTFTRSSPYSYWTSLSPLRPSPHFHCQNQPLALGNHHSCRGIIVARITTL